MNINLNHLKIVSYDMKIGDTIHENIIVFNGNKVTQQEVENAIQNNEANNYFVVIPKQFWHSIFEGYASDISEELFEDLIDYKVVEITSGYDYDYNETESYVEITLEEK